VLGDPLRAPEPDPPLSPALIRELHADLIRQKRRTLFVSSPLLLLAGYVWLAAAGDPAHLGGLVFWAIIAFAAIGRVAYEWVKLRRADPMAHYQQEQANAAARRVELIEHAEREAATRPIVTMALTALIVLVTVVQFSSGPLINSIPAAALVKPAVRAGQWWRLLTASYMHGNLLHLVCNAGALMTLGRLVETYDRRMRVPLIYLASAIGGNVLSTLTSTRSAVGASGGVLGLAGYLLIVAGRQPGGAPAWIRQRMWAIIGPTALMGLAAYFFIDNAAHAGGTLTGAALGRFAIQTPRVSDARLKALDALGWVAAAVLLAGALFTVKRLLG
jgi:membrane associated rhomboid family serine protease